VNERSIKKKTTLTKRGGDRGERAEVIVANVRRWSWPIRTKGEWKERRKGAVTKRTEVIVTNRAEGEDEGTEGERGRTGRRWEWATEIAKNRSRNTFFVFGMQRFKYKGVEFVMFRNETVRTLKGL
jgi:hypothetical protein